MAGIRPLRGDGRAEFTELEREIFYHPQGGGRVLDATFDIAALYAYHEAKILRISYSSKKFYDLNESRRKQQCRAVLKALAKNKSERRISFFSNVSK